MHTLSMVTLLHVEVTNTDRLFFSFPLQSTRSSGTTCRASPSTAMRSFPLPTKLTQETKNKGKHQTEFDIVLFMLGLQRAGSSKRKCNENKCKCIVQMTRVQRVPCFHILCLYTEMFRGINHRTDFFWRRVNWVCSNQTCHRRNKVCFRGPKDAFYVFFAAVCKLFSAYELWHLYIQHM